MNSDWAMGNLLFDLSVCRNICRVSRKIYFKVSKKKGQTLNFFNYTEEPQTPNAPAGAGAQWVPNRAGHL